MTLRTQLQKIIEQGKSVELTIKKVLKAAEEHQWIISKEIIHHVLNQDTSNNEKVYILMESIEGY